ncbi:MAG: alkaline phosphatase family protein, partial [Thermoplasmata archaeon]
MGLSIKKEQRGVLFAFLVCIIIGVSAELIAFQGFISFQATNPIMTIEEEGMRKFDTNITEKVILIVVDGMRIDQVLWSEYYKGLWNKSANGILDVGIPSYSYPGWTVISTGAWQETTGVTSNWYDKEVRVETIYNAINRSGKRSGVFGATGWKTICGKGMSGGSFIDWKDDPKVDDITAEKAYRALLADEYDYYLIHFQDLDEMNHKYGSLSSESRASMDRISRLTRDILEVANLSYTTVIITSDHGHIDRGGHGGTEWIATHVPIMIFGKGVKEGMNVIKGKQVDIAPTVSFLLSAYMPSSCEGVALLDAFDVPERVKAKALIENCLQLKDFADKYTSALNAAAPSTVQLDSARETVNTNATQSIIHARSYIVENRKACENARENAIEKERPTKQALAILIGMSIPIGIISYLGAKKSLGMRLGIVSKYLPVVVVSVIMHMAIFYIIFLSMGSRFSMSMIESEVSVLVYVPIASVATFGGVITSLALFD